MADFGATLLASLQIFQIEFTLGTLTFSLWQIFLWGIVAGAVVWLVVKWVSD